MNLPGNGAQVRKAARQVPAVSWGRTLKAIASVELSSTWTGACKKKVGIMQNRTSEHSRYANISPLDHRYAVSDPELYEKLSSYLSEDAFVRYQLRVEIALARALAGLGMCPPEAARQIESAAAQVEPGQVYEEESVTRHNIRALVNCIRQGVAEEFRPFVHLGATSADILDTARSLQYREATDNLVLPALRALERSLIGIARTGAYTPQIGRTHGQHAVPISFGFTVASYVNRLGGRIETISAASSNLRGKLSGAVGAYNALSLLTADPEAVERRVLGELGLGPSGHSTQIVEPEYVTDYVHSLISCLGVLANIGDDMRHLQRTEIGEVAEAFEGAHQVGSSTMPHKRNPWNFEHVKSLWKEFMPRSVTVYADQISEHQRDLTNSASSRFSCEIIAGLVLAAERLGSVIPRLVMDTERMAANLRSSAGLVVAEPLYIVLSALGHPDAHECVRRLAVSASREGVPLLGTARRMPELAAYFSRMTRAQLEILEHPENYTGIAGPKTLAVCSYWEERLGLGGAGSEQERGTSCDADQR